MNDTPPDIERRMTELFMSRSAGERMRAACPDFEPVDRARIVARLRADATPPG